MDGSDFVRNTEKDVWILIFREGSGIIAGAFFYVYGRRI